MKKKLLKENSKNLSRTPEESAKEAAKLMKTNLDGSKISKNIEKIVDDILKGNTSKYHKSALGKEKGLSESIEDQELMDTEDDFKSTLESINSEDENEDDYRISEDEELTLDDISFDESEDNKEVVDADVEVSDEDDDEVVDADVEVSDEDGEEVVDADADVEVDDETEEAPVDENEDIDLSITSPKYENEDETLPDFTPESEEMDFTENENSDSDDEGVVDVPETDPESEDMTSKIEEYEAEANEIKEKVESMMEKIDSEIMDANLKESLSVMFEMYGNTKAKSIAIKKANTILNGVNSYLTSLVKEFVITNKKAINESIEASKKVKLYETLTHAIKKVYGKENLQESYMDEVVFKNVIKLQKNENAKLKKALTEQKLEVEKMKAKLIFIEETKNMSDLEKKRLSKIIENYGDFKSVEDFKSKLNIIKENFSIGGASKSKTSLTESKIQSAIKETKVKKVENDEDDEEKKDDIIDESKRVKIDKYKQWL